MLNESKNEKKNIHFYIKRMAVKHNISMFISIVSNDDVLHLPVSHWIYTNEKGAKQEMLA